MWPCIPRRRVHAQCTEAGELCLAVPAGTVLVPCGFSVYPGYIRVALPQPTSVPSPHPWLESELCVVFHLMFSVSVFLSFSSRIVVNSLLVVKH